MCPRKINWDEIKKIIPEAFSSEKQDQKSAISLPYKKPSETPKLKKKIIREYVIEYNLIIKLDIFFFIGIMIMILSLMMLLVSIQGIPQKLINITIAVSMSAIISSSIGFIYFKEPCKMKFIFQNSEFLTDVLKYVPISVGIIIISSFLLELLVQSGSTFETQDYQAYNQVFVILQAISEEMLFSLLIQSIIISLSKNKYQIIIFSILNAFLFSYYHIFVYKDKILIYLFIFRLVLITIYYYSRRISIPIITHLIINILSVTVIK
ncbi:MAG: lysostaphin resistance A-like protein [Promethearchaeota archaeon]